MIIGIGTDLLDITRFNKNFPEDAFSIDEINDMENNIGKLACNFAIKEAVIKAFKKGLFAVDLKDIVVSRDSAGAPYIKSWPRYLLDTKTCPNIMVTASHEKILLDDGTHTLVSTVAIIETT